MGHDSHERDAGILIMVGNICRSNFCKTATKTSFHVGLWGFGFPTAAFISLTLEVGRRLEVVWIGLLGSVLWALLLLAILLLSFKTFQGLKSGKIWQR